MYLAMVETNGNQAYIFATQRQRDQIGASWLLKRLPEWYDRFIEESDWSAGAPVTITKTSGKVIARFAQKQDAKRFVTRMTSRAAVEAPGMDVSGVYLEIADERASEGEIAQLHKLAAKYRRKRPSPIARFPSTPLSVPCVDSGMPASVKEEWERLGVSRDRPLAEAVRVKRHYAKDGREEILNLVADYRVGDDPQILQAWGEEAWGEEFSKRLVPHLYLLENLINADEAENEDDTAGGGEETSAKPLSWVGVIHADANGMGAVFGSLEEAMYEVALDNDDEDLLDNGHVESFSRSVSSRLEEATKAAFAAAWTETLRSATYDYLNGDRGRPRKPPVIPVVPVVLGGDDVTVITDGRYALMFAEAYVKSFERITAEDGILRHLVEGRRGGNDPEGLAAAVGVAIVKTTFPFYDAYLMAEFLCGHAKDASRRIPMLDFHVHYDSSTVKMSECRKQYETVTARPFYVEKDRFAASEFTEYRSWGRFKETVNIVATQGEEESLSRSQQAAVRQVLIDEPSTAKNRWELLHQRADANRESADANRQRKAIDDVSGPERSLYWVEETGKVPATARPWSGGNAVEARRSLLLDVMQARDILPAAAFGVPPVPVQFSERQEP